MRKIIIGLCIAALAQADTYNVYNYVPGGQVNMVNGPTNHYSNNTRQAVSNYILHRDTRTYHLGDERIRGRQWARLHGQCYFINFIGASGDYILGIDMFGTESAALFINESAIGYLPPQIIYRGKRRPNYWSGKNWISIPNDMIMNGRNYLAICSSPVPNPEFRGDVDDFQIRNIELSVNR